MLNIELYKFEKYQKNSKQKLISIEAIRNEIIVVTFIIEQFYKINRLSSKRAKRGM